MARAVPFALAMLITGASLAAAADPKLPPGQDRGGPAVAIVSAGIDYSDPAIEPRLARDGEGELIGWDFVDGDNRPYAKGQPGRAMAMALELMPGARVIPVRVAADDPQAMARALAFVEATPARAVILAIAPSAPEGWAALEAAASEASELHIALIACAVPDGAAESIAKLANVKTIPCE